MDKQAQIEALKKQLESGEIDQSKYDAEIAKLEKQDDKEDKDKLTLEEVKKLIQSSEDKVRTEYSKKLKDREEELEKLKREKMTEEERAKHDADKLKSELAEKEATLTKREVALHTVDKLRESELPLEFREILAGATVEDTDNRIKTFAEQWQKSLKAAVDAKFKEHGADPHRSKQDTGDKNPWSKEHFNLTEQGRIYKEDKQKAIQLAAAAGTKLT